MIHVLALLVLVVASPRVALLRWALRHAGGLLLWEWTPTLPQQATS